MTTESFSNLQIAIVTEALIKIMLLRSRSVIIASRPKPLKPQLLLLLTVTAGTETSVTARYDEYANEDAQYQEDGGTTTTTAIMTTTAATKATTATVMTTTRIPRQQ